jgi:hypothetical protein
MITDDQLKKLRQTPPQWTEDKASDAQIGYVKLLVEDREVPEPWLLRIKELHEKEGGLTKGEASNIIGSLKSLPKKPQTDDRTKNNPTLKDVPVGRYAIHGDDEDDIKFFRVKDVRGGYGKDGGYRLLLRIAGPNEHPIRMHETKDIVKSIIRFGIGNAAALYGNKVGKCSKCHTRITNRISRRLGIGPVCGGHYYEDWDERVNTARTELRALGLDPNENVEEDNG